MTSSPELNQAVSRIEKARALMSDHLTLSSQEVITDLLDEALASLETVKAFHPFRPPPKCPLMNPS